MSNVRSHLATLSSSDWISLAGALAQIVVAIAVAVYQVRASRATGLAGKSSKSAGPAEQSNIAWYFKNAWGFLVGIPMSIAFICWEAVGSGPTTLGSVLTIVFLSLWLAFNIFCAAGYALAAPFRQAYAKLEAMASKGET